MRLGHALRYDEHWTNGNVEFFDGFRDFPLDHHGKLLGDPQPVNDPHYLLVAQTGRLTSSLEIGSECHAYNHLGIREGIGIWGVPPLA